MVETVLMVKMAVMVITNFILIIGLNFTFIQLFIFLGIDGIDGNDVPEKKDYHELDILDLRCGDFVTVHNGTEYTAERKYCGTMATQGTNGGDGGCGGSGGSAGEVQIFGLTNPSDIVPVQQNGMGKFFVIILV